MTLATRVNRQAKPLVAEVALRTSLQLSLMALHPVNESDYRAFPQITCDFEGKIVDVPGPFASAPSIRE